MIIKGTARLHIDPKKGSATIYLEKEFTENMLKSKKALPDKTKLVTEYDDETGELCIKVL
jgi:hypothetical protein